MSNYIERNEQRHNLVRLGIKSARHGNFLDAIVYYDKALELEPPDYTLILPQKIQAFLNLHRHDEALQLCDFSLQIFPNNVYALTKKASIFKLDSHYEDALDLLDRVLLIDENNPKALFQKGSTLIFLHRYEEGILWLEKAEPNYSDYVMLLNTKAHALTKLFRVDEALACYDQVLEKEPHNDLALTAKNELEDTKKQLELKDSMKMFDDNSVFYAMSLVNVAREHLKQCRFDDAEKLFFQARNIFISNNLTNEEHYAILLQYMGELFHSQNKLDDELKCFMDSRKIYVNLNRKNLPEYRIILKIIAGIYLWKNDFSKGRPFIEELSIETKTNVNENDPEYVDLMEAIKIFNEKEENLHR